MQQQNLDKKHLKAMAKYNSKIYSTNIKMQSAKCNIQI